MRRSASNTKNPDANEVVQKLRARADAMELTHYDRTRIRHIEKKYDTAPDLIAAYGRFFADKGLTTAFTK